MKNQLGEIERSIEGEFQSLPIGPFGKIHLSSEFGISSDLTPPPPDKTSSRQLSVKHLYLKTRLEWVAASDKFRVSRIVLRETREMKLADSCATVG